MSAANQQRRERTRRPVAILLAAVLLIALVAVGVWALIQEPPPLQIRRLPDGSVIRLEAVTMGPKHRFVAGSRAREWLDWLQDQLGRAPASLSPSNPRALVFWTTRSPASRLGTRGHIVFFDEHGCEFEGDSFLPQSQPGDPRVVEGWPTPLVPRRAKWIGLRFDDFADPSHPVRLVEFQVPNPAAGPEPVWRPEALPATRRVGDAAFTLTMLQFGLAGPGPPLRPAMQRGRGWTRAGFRATEAGRPTSGWAPAGITLSDASGNIAFALRAKSCRLHDETHLFFKQGLCIDEPAWKLRVPFERVGGFPAGDLWTVRGVPITRRGSLRRFGVTTRRHGATVELFGVAAPGVVATGLEIIPRARPLLALRVSPLSTDVRLKLVRVTDQRGRTIDWVPYQAGSEVLSQGYGFGLKAPDDTKRVDLTFALSRSQLAEFVVRPTRWSRASGS